MLVGNGGRPPSDPDEEELRIATSMDVETKFRSFGCVLIELNEMENPVFWILARAELSPALPLNDVENLIIVDDNDSLPLMFDGRVFTGFGGEVERLDCSGSDLEELLVRRREDDEFKAAEKEDDGEEDDAVDDEMLTGDSNGVTCRFQGPWRIGEVGRVVTDIMKKARQYGSSILHTAVCIQSGTVCGWQSGCYKAITKSRCYVLRSLQQNASEPRGLERNIQKREDGVFLIVEARACDASFLCKRDSEVLQYDGHVD